MVWQGPSWVASGNEGSRKLCYGLSCNLGGAWRHGTPPPLVDTLLREGHIDTVAAGLASKLSTVRWLKSDAWVGIAIKVTPTGYSFAGGAKDSGSAAFRALADDNDQNYLKVRNGVILKAA